MATTINGLEELVKLPLGCGEQNMLSLAASIYMLKYLETISRIDNDFKEKAQSIMRNGLFIEHVIHTFIHEFLTWALPSRVLNTSIVANRAFSQKWITKCKQWRSWWDGPSRAVSSWFALFAMAPALVYREKRFRWNPSSLFPQVF